MPSARAESSPPAFGERLFVRPLQKLSWRLLWDYPRQLLSLLSFILTGLTVCPICTLALGLFGNRIPAGTGQKLIRWLFDTWLTFSQRLGVFEIEFHGIEGLKNLQGTIIAPNHPSQLDAVLLLIHVPRAVCIMRASLMRNLWLGGAARMARYVTNDRGPALIREGIEKIREGENLLIFPEGTRTKDQAVNRFHHGFALIALKTGAPIQTILIEREGRYLGKGISLFAPTKLPIRLKVHLGSHLEAENGETAKRLSSRLEQYFQANLINTGTDIRRNPVVR